LLLLRQPALRRIFKTLWANSGAAGRYVPQPYPDRLLLMRVEQESVSSQSTNQALGDQSLGWSALVAGGVEVQRVPGHHLNFLRQPHVKVVGQKLSLCLDQAQMVKKAL
jgi:thioesterase domain-containing protein